MDDFMRFLYDHYIQPHIQRQERDDADKFHLSLLECEIMEKEREDVTCELRFYACHAFLLGLKTGEGLTGRF